jgi:bis(5'-nucleosyl)-tetraphosphatase (symmetrical)
MESFLLLGMLSIPALLLRQRKRILIIGDVHGCLDEFKELIETCEKKEEIEEIYQVGDLVNKGPKSLEVIDYVIKKKVKCILGNHDEVAVLSYEKKNKTIDWVEKMNETQYNYLKTLPLYRKIPEYNLLLVHAGLY